VSAPGRNLTPPPLPPAAPAQEVAAACNISAMPTFQVFKNGAKVDEFVGASKDKLKALCDKYA
jgi:thioredoxin-like negative regulator of GroEL